MSTPTRLFISPAAIFLSPLDLETNHATEQDGNWTTIYSMLENVQSNANALNHFLQTTPLQHQIPPASARSSRSLQESLKGLEVSSIPQAVHSTVDIDSVRLIPGLSRLLHMHLGSMTAGPEDERARRRIKYLVESLDRVSKYYSTPGGGKMDLIDAQNQMSEVSDKVAALYDRVSFLTLVVDTAALCDAQNDDSESDQNYRDWTKKITEMGCTAIACLRSKAMDPRVSGEEVAILDRVREQLKEISPPSGSDLRTLAACLLPSKVSLLLGPLSSLVDDTVAANFDLGIPMEKVRTLGKAIRANIHYPEAGQDGEEMEEFYAQTQRSMQDATEELEAVFDLVSDANEWYQGHEAKDRLSILSFLLVPSDLHDLSGTREQVNKIEADVADGLKHLTSMMRDIARSERDNLLSDLAGRLSEFAAIQHPVLVDSEILRRDDAALLPTLAETVRNSSQSEQLSALSTALEKVVQTYSEPYDPDNCDDETTSKPYYDRWMALEGMREVTASLITSGISIRFHNDNEDAQKPAGWSVELPERSKRDREDPEHSEMKRTAKHR